MRRIGSSLEYKMNVRLQNKGAWKLVSFILLGIFLICIASFVLQSDFYLQNEPQDCTALEREPEIYPDYRDIVAPNNIAPLNFDINESDVEKALTVVKVEKFDPKGEKANLRDAGERGEKVASFTGTKIRFSKKKWKKILSEHGGDTLVFSIYVKRDGSWEKFDDWTISISNDKIDSWVSYRKIAPGYEYFSDLALWNRNVETFEERPFFRARLYRERTCVNCHSYQNYRTDAFFFHQRFSGAGTVFGINGKVLKRDLNADGLQGGCAYPSWRPNSLHVAFASCSTFQTFHTSSPDRIDVLDGFSDLYLYDVVNNSLSPIVSNGDDTLDTYPSWSPDGSTLYYCSAKNPGFKTTRESTQEENNVATIDRKSETLQIRENLKYDIKKISFDEATGEFGASEIVFSASSQGKSALFPRISPDGKSMLFTLTRYGCFPIWYRDADIWLMDLTTGQSRPIEEINSPSESDSYHSWNSTGRWIVFSSRRDDGTYTRLYFSHLEDSGRFSKPFMLPQEDPRQNLDNMRSYNVPEFTIEPVKISERRILEVDKKSTPEKAVLKRGK